MAPRRRRPAQKKANALSSFISAQARQLDRLVRYLNTRWIGPHAQLGTEVAAIIEANRPVVFPAVGGRAGELFRALAAGHTFRYEVHVLSAAPTAPASWRKDGVAMV